MRIIHDEDIGLRIFREVALRDVLPVAAVVGEGDGFLVEDFDEPFRAAAMLDVGLAVGIRGREIETVGLGQEGREVFVDLGAPAAALLEVGIPVAGALAGLDRLHRRRKRDIGGIGVNV
jgi:hypothetical protein